jgi:integrase
MKKRLSIGIGDELTEEMKKIDKPLGFNSQSSVFKNNGGEPFKPLSKEELLNYPEVQTWLKNVGEHTRNSYPSYLKKFCDWCGKTPKQLILDRDRETKTEDPNGRTGIRDLILDFREHMENEGYAPNTVNVYDGAIRGFFSAVLGKIGMVNIGNYRRKGISQRQDLVPTLEELKKMLDAVSLEDKLRIILFAQTGLRPSNGLKVTYGGVRRELELGSVPLAIKYYPDKDQEKIGERITFLASDGIEILKQDLQRRKENGEEITDETPILAGRSKKYGKKSIVAISEHMLNQTVQKAAKIAGLLNNEKYGRVRTYSLRKFFVTQLTNHGVEDKIVNFFIGHKISDVDRVYWVRRVEELRKIYAERQQYLNPINGKRNTYDLKKLEGIQAKIKEMDSKIDSLHKEIDLRKKAEMSQNNFESKMVSTEEEIIELSNQGYDCQPIGKDRWLMRRGKLYNKPIRLDNDKQWEVKQDILKEKPQTNLNKLL